MVVVPAWPVMVLAAVATATLFALVAGPSRRWGGLLVGVAVATMGAARIALAWDSASAVLASAGLGCSAAALAFSVLAPKGRSR